MAHEIQYSKSTAQTIFLAERFFLGHPLQEETKNDLRDLMLCQYWVNYCFDRAPKAETPLMVTKIFGVLRDGEEPEFNTDERLGRSLINLRRVLDKLPVERKEYFFDTVKELFRLGQLMRETTDIRQLVKARKIEGVLSAELVLTIADELSSNIAFRNFYRETAIVGNLLDSIQDARSDVVEGKIKVPPVKLAFSMAKHIVCEVPQVIMTSPKSVSFYGFVAKSILRRLGITQSIVQQKAESLANPENILLARPANYNSESERLQNGEVLGGRARATPEAYPSN